MRITLEWVKSTASLVLFLLWSSALVAQEWRKVDEQSVICKSFAVDALQNTYLLNDDYIELIRYQDGRAFRSSFLEYGSNYHLDLTNPLKPFLFYPDQGIALFLDNMLSFQGELVRWQEMGFEQIEWMAGSRGDHFWIWDGAANELLRVNKQFQVQQRTGELSARLGKVIRPKQILECADDVCIVTELGEVIVLDLFGAYRSTFRLTPGCVLMGFSGATVAWQDQGEVHSMDMQSWNEEVVKLPLEDLIFTSWSNGFWFTLRQGKIERYTYGL